MSHNLLLPGSNLSKILVHLEGLPRWCFIAVGRLHWVDNMDVSYKNVSPDSKVHRGNMGPTWGRQDPGGPHVGPMNLAILVIMLSNAAIQMLFRSVAWSELVTIFNALKPEQNGWNLACNILRSIFFRKHVLIWLNFHWSFFLRTEKSTFSAKD